MLKSDKIEKRYYSVYEVADILGVAPSFLRFYDEQLHIRIPRRDKRSSRGYQKIHIEQMRWVVKASKIYHVVILRAAVRLFRHTRLMHPHMLTNEEIETIYQYLKYDTTGKVPTTRRQNINPS